MGDACPLEDGGCGQRVSMGRSLYPASGELDGDGDQRVSWEVRLNRVATIDSKIVLLLVLSGYVLNVILELVMPISHFRAFGDSYRQWSNYDL